MATNYFPSQLTRFTLDYKELEYAITPSVDLTGHKFTMTNTESGMSRVVSFVDTPINKGVEANYGMDPVTTDYVALTFKFEFYTTSGETIVENFTLRPLCYEESASFWSRPGQLKVKGTTLTFDYDGSNPLTVNTVTGKYSINEATAYDYDWVDFERANNKPISKTFTVADLKPNTNYKVCTWAVSNGGEWGCISIRFFTTGTDQLTITYNDQGTLKKASVYFNDAGTIKPVIEGYTNVNGELKQIENS